jgi:hypothetical protein
MMDKCERCGSEPDIDYYGIALCKICRQDLESKAESLTEPCPAYQGTGLKTDINGVVEDEPCPECGG